jgi:predicted RNA binding protein YcfA (HicA-like mRNA interferase family)
MIAQAFGYFFPQDMARQAVLERLGWRFIRIRGGRFYRNPDATMEVVTGELSDLGVQPVKQVRNAEPATIEEGLRERVVRRAYELIREWSDFREVAG